MARLTRVRMVAGLTYSVWAISLSATRMPGRAGRRHCPRGWTGACPGFTWSPPTSRQPGCPVSRRLSGLPGTDAARLSASRRVLCARRLALIEETARENLAEARGLVAAFSPVALDGADLADALDRLAQRIGAETGIAVVVDVDRAATAHLRRADEVVLLRAAQEALTNVRRHAHASEVRVTITEDSGMVRLGVHDDGVGIGAGSAEGYGLRGMRSRVDAVAGQMSVRAVEGGGTVLDVAVPAVAR